MNSNIELAKKICKNHGLKGFRKLALKSPTFVAGKQTVWISDFLGERLLDRLVEEGFVIAGLDVARQLAAKGQLDCITIKV